MTEFYTNFQFLRPWWLLVLLPGGVIWWLLHRSADPLKMYRGLIEPHLLKHLVVGDAAKGLLHPVRLFPLVWLLLSVALAGPSWRMEPSPFAEQQAGLMVLLKTSSSMGAQDLPPTRLERAVYKMRDLFEVRGQEPSGLIAYSGSAHLVMPLTKDTRIIEQMAGELDPTVMPVDGDRLGDALELARQQFERNGTTGSILVIADGIDDSQAGLLDEFRKNNGPGVQVLALGPEPRAARAAVAGGAKTLGAPVFTLTTDDGDVRDIVAGAKRLVSNIHAQAQGARRRADGYLLVPVLAALIALWARRGWSLQWR
jgi:Ca-activated chloride channel family protein